MIKLFHYLKLSSFFILFAILSNSCENSIEVINSMGPGKELPASSATEVEILYSDSGVIRMKITAPILNKFNSPEKQYIEFPKGIVCYQYGPGMKLEAMVRCNFAIFHEQTKIWEARNDVLVKNMTKNEQLNTEEMFWDQEKRIIYSDKFTKITNEDGVFVGDKFQSKEDLSNWKLSSVKGTVNIKDTPNETETP